MWTTQTIHQQAHLYRSFSFDRYVLAIQFVEKVAQLAEQQDHHPEIRITYHRVEVYWRTYDADAITELDHQMAQQCDSLYASFNHS